MECPERDLRSGLTKSLVQVLKTKKADDLHLTLLLRTISLSSLSPEGPLRAKKSRQRSDPTQWQAVVTRRQRAESRHHR